MSLTKEEEASRVVSMLFERISRAERKKVMRSLLETEGMEDYAKLLLAQKKIKEIEERELKRAVRLIRSQKEKNIY